MHTASKISVRTITMTALLSAIAYILAFVEFPVPLSPSFARMDFSDFPALIGVFAFGPLTGVLIELVKNALQLFSTSTGGIGELANFLIASFAEFIPFIHTKLDIVLYNAFPFNLLKGFVISVVAMLVYKRLRPVLKGAV